MSLVHEIDYGTPASKSAETVKLTTREAASAPEPMSATLKLLPALRL